VARLDSVSDMAGDVMSGHTKLPWRFVPWHIEEDSSAVRSPDGWIVCTTSSDADAAFITRACNNFEELVEALSGIINSDIAMREEDEGRVSPELECARAALNKALGEKM
jgi:hypothetical protein